MVLTIKRKDIKSYAPVKFNADKYYVHFNKFSKA